MQQQQQQQQQQKRRRSTRFTFNALTALLCHTSSYSTTQNNMAASKVIELEMSEMTEKIEEPEKRISLFDLDSKSVRLLGEEILINANLLSRVKWGQRGMCIWFSFIVNLYFV